MKNFIIALALIFSSYSSYACSCVIPKLAKKYENSDFVADVTVVKIYKNAKNDDSYKADIKINTLYKGTSLKSIYVRGRSTGKARTSCDIFIAVGTRLIAYSSNNEEKYYVGMCSGLVYIKRKKTYKRQPSYIKKQKETLKTEIEFLENQKQIKIQTETSQEQTKDYSSQVATLDSTIKTLYAVISGDKGVERDWDLFKHLFHKDAKLIPTGKNKEGKHAARYITPEDYIKSSGKWLYENGFHEVEMSRKTQTFGNITQVFSTYESFKKKDDKEPFMRGINSIQLMNDGERWWIINIYWMQESEENPIPEEYLPN